MTNKICKLCNSEFEYNNTNRKYCKECSKISFIKRYWMMNPELMKERSRIHRKNNLEKCRECCRLSQITVNNRERFGGNRQHVLNRDDYNCQICLCDVSGKGKPCVHHLDKDKTNNSIENLQTLCLSCHAKLHYDKEHPLNNYQYKSIQKYGK